MTEKIQMNTLENKVIAKDNTINNTMANAIVGTCDGNNSQIKTLNTIQLHKIQDPLSLQLMPPPIGTISKRRDPIQQHPQYNYKKKKIVSEEEYLEDIGNIIERDFFPQLHSLKQQDLGDLASIASVDSRDQRISASQSLDAYFGLHMSEDNRSFHDILEKDTEERQRKFHWAFDNINQIGDKYQQDHKMLYYMDNRVLSLEEREKFDLILNEPTTSTNDRPAVPKSWENQIRNPFMFAPDAVIKSFDEKGDVFYKTIENQTQGKVTESRQKQIIYKNTHFEDNQVTVIPPSPYELPHTPSQFSDNGSWDTNSVVSTQKKKNRDYRLVEMTPNINPVDKSPMMTWGQVIATPMILTANTPQVSNTNSSLVNVTDTSSFLISDVSQRELIARKLENKSNKSTTGDISSTPRSTLSMKSTISGKSVRSTMSSKSKASSGRYGNLSDAGLKLANKLFPRTSIMKEQN